MALAGFRHQHIVTLYDLIEKNDGWYMVMELVDGPTLADLIKEAPLPPEAVAVLGLQLASALEHAHFHRVVHRDLKPGNVMLSTWGDVKLMDFGIVQTAELERLTQTGMAVGTPAYMSPEQVTGATVDPRSDLYSLGVVLYEALSGKRPYTGTNPGEVFAKVTTGRREALKKAAPKAPTGAGATSSSARWRRRPTTATPTRPRCGGPSRRCSAGSTRRRRRCW